jgi:hypothetical protein
MRVCCPTASSLLYPVSAAVSRQRGECRIYVPNCPVKIGDDDGIGGLLHGRSQAGPLNFVIIPAHV